MTIAHTVYIYIYRAYEHPDVKKKHSMTPHLWRAKTQDFFTSTNLPTHLHHFPECRDGIGPIDPFFGLLVFISRPMAFRAFRPRGAAVALEAPNCQTAVCYVFGACVHPKIQVPQVTEVTSASCWMRISQ